MIAFLAINVNAQKPVKSPPMTATGSIDNIDITIAYNSPGVKDRTTWGGQLVPYDKVWRTGANGATWIELSKDAMIEGKPLAAGKYSIFTIPHEDDTCTVIFNKIWEQWGHYKYDDSKDALRVKVSKNSSDDEIERMAFEVNADNILLKWHNWSVPIKVKGA